MVRANSGAGGKPDPTFGRCTIFSILHQSKKKEGCLVSTLVPPFGTPRAGSGVFPSRIGSLILVLCLAPGSQFPLASWSGAPAVGSSFWCYVRWLWPLAAALAPSLWSSPAAVGCSLPRFYKKLLFRIDLLEYSIFVDMIFLCVVFHCG